MGKVGASVKILLEIDRVLNAEQLDALQSTAAYAEREELQTSSPT